MSNVALLGFLPGTTGPEAAGVGMGARSPGSEPPGMEGNTALVPCQIPAL